MLKNKFNRQTFAFATISLASILFAVALPFFSIILKEGTAPDRILFVLIGIVVIYAHRTNIRRLLNGKEPKTVLWGSK